MKKDVSRSIKKVIIYPYIIEVNKALCGLKKVTLTDILYSKVKKEEVIFARSFIASVLRDKEYTLTKIAEILGFKSHATVINLLRNWDYIYVSQSSKFFQARHKLDNHTKNYHQKTNVENISFSKETILQIRGNADYYMVSKDRKTFIYKLEDVAKLNIKNKEDKKLIEKLKHLYVDYITI